MEETTKRGNLQKVVPFRLAVTEERLGTAVIRKWFFVNFVAGRLGLVLVSGRWLPQFPNPWKREATGNELRD